MKIKEYIGRYEALQNSIKSDEKLIKMLETSCGGMLLQRLDGSKGSLSPAGIRTVSSLVLTTDKLRIRLNRKLRLYEKYTVRLTLAARMIEKKPLRDYVIAHYLYGLTHEEVAEMNHYCERQIYRQAQEARKALFDALVLLNPKPRHIKSARYHIKHSRHFAA